MYNITIYSQGDVWICMECMDTSLDKFYKMVYEKEETKIEDSLLAYIAICVSIIPTCTIICYSPFPSQSLSIHTPFLLTYISAKSLYITITTIMPVMP